MVHQQQTPLFSLTKASYSYQSPQKEHDEEKEAAEYFKRMQSSVQELEAAYLNLCLGAKSMDQERVLARKYCVSAQEDLDKLRKRHRKMFPACRVFMTESEIIDVATPDEEGEIIQILPSAQDFVQAMETDVKEIAEVVKCDWRKLLPKALDDLERAWRAAEKTSQPVGLSWSEVRNAIVQNYHCTLQ